MNKYIISFAALMPFIFSSTLFAFTCPTNFSIINVGDSIESVTQKCGKPVSEKKEEKEKPQPQEWTYFQTETVATNTTYSSTGTLKVSVTFDKDDKAINISVNGIGVGASSICGNPIQLGDSREKVKSTCGKPSFVNKQTGDENKSEDKDTIIEYTYKGSSQNVLVFTNGKLTDVK